MEKRFLKAILAILLLPVCANATTIDFYTDGTITDGNVFDTVNTWDSATVNMTGGNTNFMYCYDTSGLNFNNGLISSLRSYNNSIVNMTGGEVDNLIRSYDNSIVNISGGLVGRSGIELCNSSMLNLSGGVFESDNWTTTINATDDGSRIHLYGYGFTFTKYSTSSIRVEGFWADSTPFKFILYRTDYPSPNVVLHIVPEPCTIGLICFGFLVMRRHVKIHHIDEQNHL